MSAKDLSDFFLSLFFFGQINGITPTGIQDMFAVGAG